jgi:hypothetical protein
MLVLLIACGRPPPAGFTVELDVFSGRPNPTWRVEGSEAIELRRLWRERVLPAANPQTTAALAATGLGYRGFIIHDASGALAKADRLEIGGGMVRSVDSDGRTVGVFVDDERAIERWLIAGARGRTDVGLLPN